MWRLIRLRSFRSLGRRCVATPSNASGAAAESFSAHPILFDVPAIERAVGRDAELMSLWQSLLSGRRVQAITGPDGIGKSTLAAEFCERARRSGRFTCIHWLSGRDSLQSSLFELARSMKGRKEKDVLLVVDDAPDPREALRLLPDHTHLYVLLTTAVEMEAAQGIGVLRAQPLGPDTAAQFSLTLDTNTYGLAEMLCAVGHVPLLMHMACCLVDSESATPEEIQQRLRDAGEDGASGALRVSCALRVLLDIGLAKLRDEYPLAARHLAVLACFDTSDISPAVVDRVLGGDNAEGDGVLEDSGDEFATRVVALGICSPRFDDAAALTMHPLVAQLLRSIPVEKNPVEESPVEESSVEESPVEKNPVEKNPVEKNPVEESPVEESPVEGAAAVLHALWPRRWRGDGHCVSRNALVRHSRAILSTASASTPSPLPLPRDLLRCLDRSATLLALGEGRDLPTAAELWLRVVRANELEKRCDAEAVRVARECGRLLHFLRDPQASDVLQGAWDAAAVVHGRQSPEAALVLGCLAPYMSSGREALETLRSGVAALEGRLASVDAVMGREEARMMLETIFVLLVRQGQMLEELGERTPEKLWTDLEEVKERIQKCGGGQS